MCISQFLETIAFPDHKDHEQTCWGARLICSRDLPSPSQPPSLIWISKYSQYQLLAFGSTAISYSYRECEINNTRKSVFKNYMGYLPELLNLILLDFLYNFDHRNYKR